MVERAFPGTTFGGDSLADGLESFQDRNGVEFGFQHLLRETAILRTVVPLLLMRRMTVPVGCSCSLKLLN